MKRKLLLIFLLALLLRTYKLASFPVGLHADEVRIGWNAYSIYKTGLDDRGNTMALYYNTFGDYRPTAIFYTTIPALQIFGLNEFAIRFPASFFGALTVIPIFYLGGLTAALLLAVSPWHIATSRASSEVIISMFFMLSSIVLYIKALKTDSKQNYLSSSILILISYVFYHSIRLLAPIFLLVTFIYKTNVKSYKVGFLIIIFSALLTFFLAINPNARGRFSQVSIFNTIDVQKELMRMPFEEGNDNVLIARLYHNKLLTYGRYFINEYISYFSADYLIGDVAKPARYTTPSIGMLLYIELLLFVIGLIAIAQKKASTYPLLMLLASPLAAALTTEDTPNLQRSLYMAPFIILIAASGLLLIKKVSRPAYYVTLGLLAINFIFFAHMYLIHGKYKIAESRNYGAKEVAMYIIEQRHEYDKIITTDIPDSLYPWLAFYGKYNPNSFNKSAVLREKGVWNWENIEFSGQRCPSRDAFTKPEVNKLLVVDATGCETESNLHQRDDVELIFQVKRPDESTAYSMWSMKK